MSFLLSDANKRFMLSVVMSVIIFSVGVTFYIEYVEPGLVRLFLAKLVIKGVLKHTKAYLKGYNHCSCKAPQTIIGNVKEFVRSS